MKLVTYAELIAILPFGLLVRLLRFCLVEKAA